MSTPRGPDRPDDRPEEERDDDAAAPSAGDRTPPRSDDPDPTPPAGTGADPSPPAGADEASGGPEDMSATGTPAKTPRRGRKGRGKAGKPEATAGPPADEEPAAAGESDRTTAPADEGSARADSDAAEDGDANTERPADGDAAPPRRRRGGGWLIALALVVALAAAGVAGWLVSRVGELERAVARIPDERSAALEPLARRDAVRALERRLEEQGQELGRRLDQRLTSLADEREAAISALRERLEAAETALQTAREQRQRDTTDWRMAEVRYLVTVAVRRLAITRDVDSSIAALEAADQALAQLGDARVLELRQRIVDDIAALRAVEPADVEGIALRIRNLGRQVAELERAAPERQATADGEARGAAGDAAGGADGGTRPEDWWAAVRAQLDRFVSVRREPAAAPPAPGTPPASSPSGTATLPPGERLLLALRDASRAALAHEPAAYDDALGRALRVVEAEYAGGAPTTARFRESLTTLRKRPVATELPDLTTTLERTERVAARLKADGGTGSGAPADGED